MNSPDMNRLAAALAKLDDPDIIALLLEAYTPATVQQPIAVTENTPATVAPVQQELLGHIQDRFKRQRVPSQKAGRVWTTREKNLLQEMASRQVDIREMEAALGRSTRSITSALYKWHRDLWYFYRHHERKAAR